MSWASEMSMYDGSGSGQPMNVRNPIFCFKPAEGKKKAALEFLRSTGRAWKFPQNEPCGTRSNFDRRRILYLGSSKCRPPRSTSSRFRTRWFGDSLPPVDQPNPNSLFCFEPLTTQPIPLKKNRSCRCLGRPHRPVNCTT